MIYSTTPAHVQELAENMREADKTEVKALAGLGPLEALSLGYFHSDVCVTGFSPEGDLVGIGGITPTQVKGTGCVWFLSTDAVKTNAKHVLKHARAWLDEQQAQYPVLINVVSESNVVHRRLIKHLGFRFGSPINNYGADNVRVIPFERKLECVPRQ